MGARRRTERDDYEPLPPLPRARTQERREKQLIALAEALVEKKLRDGTASSQEVIHYLKLGSTRERLEQKKMEGEVKLTEAKITQLETVARIEDLYSEAIAAMRRYGANFSDEGGVDDYYED